MKPRSILFVVVPFLLVSTAAAQKKSPQEIAVGKKQIRVIGKPRRGHAYPVHGVDWSKDGKRALSCAGDGEIRLWNPASGKLVKRIHAHKGGVWRAFFYEDDKKIVSVGWDRAARFFDAKSGRKLGAIEGLPEKLTTGLLPRLDAKLTPDGTELWFPDIGSNMRDGFLRIDLTTRKLLPALKVEGNMIRDFDFTADGKRVVIAQMTQNFRGRVALYEVPAMKEVWGLASPRGSRVEFVKGDQAFLFVAPRAIELRKTADGAKDKAMGAPTDTATGFAMVPDGSAVFLGFFLDSMLLGIDLGTMKARFQYGEFLGSVNAIALAPDGSRFLAGGADGAVRFFDPQGKERFLPKGHQNRAQTVAVSKDGAHLVSGSYDNEVVLWNAKTGKPTHEVHEHKYAILGSGFNAAGQAMSASNDNTVKLIDPKTGAVTKTLPAPEGTEYMKAFAVSRDGKVCATGHADGKVHVRDAVTGAVQHTIECGKPVNGLALGPGRVIVGAGSVVHVFKMGEGKPTWSSPELAKDKKAYEDEDDVAAGAVALLNWNRIAVGHSNGKLRIFKIGAAAPVKELVLEKEAWISSLVTSPDGDVLFASVPGAIHSLGTEEFDAVRKPITATDGGVMALCAPTAEHLYAAMSDGTILRFALEKWE